MKYRKKPTEIEAVLFQLPLPEVPDWLSEAIDKAPGAQGNVFRYGDELHIHTLEGKMTAQLGDYIIQGVKGELYPCKPDIFELTYEKV